MKALAYFFLGSWLTLMCLWLGYYTELLVIEYFAGALRGW